MDLMNLMNLMNLPSGFESPTSHVVLAWLLVRFRNVLISNLHVLGLHVLYVFSTCTVQYCRVWKSASRLFCKDYVWDERALPTAICATPPRSSAC